MGVFTMMFTSCSQGVREFEGMLHRGRNSKPVHETVHEGCSLFCSQGCSLGVRMVVRLVFVWLFAWCSYGCSPRFREHVRGASREPVHRVVPLVFVCLFAWCSYGCSSRFRKYVREACREPVQLRVRRGYPLITRCLNFIMHSIMQYFKFK